MLRLLELRDFALIDRLELELGPGLHAFTGETGTGKSILVDALLQLAGNRADLSLIRSGADSALIQGEFETGSGSVTLSRRLQQGGRSSARIDGEQVTVSELFRKAEPLIAVHAQHASLELSGPDSHRRMLDRLLDSEGRSLLARTRQLHGDWLAAQQRLAELRSAVQERARRLDTIEFQLNEIRAAQPQAGEDDELRAQLVELRHADSVASGAGRALELLTENEGAAVEQLVLAVRALAGAARYSTALEPLADELQQALDGYRRQPLRSKGSSPISTPTRCCWNAVKRGSPSWRTSDASTDRVWRRCWRSRSPWSWNVSSSRGLMMNSSGWNRKLMNSKISCGGRLRS